MSRTCVAQCPISDGAPDTIIQITQEPNLHVRGLLFLSVNCAVARMVWLVVVISLNGRPPQVIEQVPFESMQGCQAEKALRDSRQSTFFVPNETSIRRAIFCSDDPGRDLKLY
jgi:hypothetical protein